MIEKVKKYFYELCKDKHFSWIPHVESTVKYAKQLAQQLGADEEIVEISAWLHDIRKIHNKDTTKNVHHIQGSETAGELLTEWGYDAAKIEKVKECILTHSSDKTYPPKTLESKVLASADALSHFDNFPLMVNSAYRHVKPDEVNKWLLDKYARTFDKMMPEAKEIAQPKYEAIKLLLGEQD
ncbi:HD domain-containing protein [Candidatus Woesearchaeota archaeon]|nr:HD domain-containing protein [Candidatus Woesearchaeota archaeon]